MESEKKQKQTEWYFNSRYYGGWLQFWWELNFVRKFRWKGCVGRIGFPLETRIIGLVERGKKNDRRRFV